MKGKITETKENESINALAERIGRLITESRSKVVTFVNTAMVYTYYEIGKYIVEDEQKGFIRAGYGKAVLKKLSSHLTSKFGKGFSVDNLQNMRNFYVCYSIYETASRISDGKQIPEKNGQTIFTLSWSHYLKLMRISNPEERRFYEIEATKNNWSLRELERQYDTSLYERLSLSRDKERVLSLSKQGQNKIKTRKSNDWNPALRG